MTTILKLGGSLITDKREERSYRGDVVARLAGEIASALDENPSRLLIGHGSGSFGHFAAQRHGTMDGVQSAAEWRGFAEVATIAAELNGLVAATLHTAGVPVWRIQPSASAICEDGVIMGMALPIIHIALSNGLVPLLYGDVALDVVRGGTIISTESIIRYLAANSRIDRVILLGEVPGVLSADGAVIPHITPQNVGAYQSALGGSAGVDVTGGMYTKVMDMLQIAQVGGGVPVDIIDGREAGLLRDALLGREVGGTRITAG